VKKGYALSIITVHTLGLHDFAEVSEDHNVLKLLTAYSTWLKPKCVKVYLYTVSRDWTCKLRRV